MSRNMKEANGAIFAALDAYCSGLGKPLSNAGKPRWIATNRAERRFLRDAVLSQEVDFAPRRKTVRFDHDHVAYFCCVGFDYVDRVMSLTEIDPHAGIVTAVLGEVLPLPTATPAQIQEDAGGTDKDSDADYEGHPSIPIATLFPPLRVFAAADVSPDDTWHTVFKLCLLECERGDSWIDGDLAATLSSVCDLSGLNLPYETLCRSVFDSDPAAMFLALYRCIEAVYAYSGATKVAASLGLTTSWAEVALVLEDQIGWHARADGALASLMRHAAEHDHKKLFGGLGEEISAKMACDLPSAAATRLYTLRNGLVHYRSSHRRIDYSRVNWNIVCSAVAGMICHMYAVVFP